MQPDILQPTNGWLLILNSSDFMIELWFVKSVWNQVNCMDPASVLASLVAG